MMEHQSGSSFVGTRGKNPADFTVAAIVRPILNSVVAENYRVKLTPRADASKCLVPRAKTQNPNPKQALNCKLPWECERLVLEFGPLEFI